MILLVHQMLLWNGHKKVTTVKMNWQDILRCRIGSVSMTYLGMPLGTPSRLSL